VAGGERGEILLGQGPNIAAGASCNPGHVHLMHLFILKNCSEEKTCQHKLPVFPKVDNASIKDVQATGNAFCPNKRTSSTS
jgi:hypothetical protein